MSNFLCKSAMFRSYCCVRTFAPNSYLSYSLRWFSSSSDQQHSFTVSYLINSIGLSPKHALSASKLVTLKTCENPDKVVRFFKGYGFTETQVSKLVRGIPKILLLNPGKTLLPKLEFLKSRGISDPEMAKMLSVFPSILGRSLDKQILPSYEFFRNLFGSDEKAILAVKRNPDLLVHDVERYVEPNVAILRGHGVPYSNVAAIIHYNHRVFVVSPDRFRNIVDQVVELGFNASRLTFVLAVSVIRSISKSTWESKVSAFKKWGWSDKEVLETFSRYPLCMKISEGKIMAGMDFFVNKMGVSYCRIAKDPSLLGLSLEKRLIPRYYVFRDLISKGLVKKEVSLDALFRSSEEEFLKKFITCYKDFAPRLLKLYKENLNLSSGPAVDNA